MTMRSPHAPPPIRSSSFSLGHRLARIAWSVVYVLLFRPSPRPMHRWRNWLLRLFGAKLHRTARAYPKSRCWAPWNLTMGEYACIGDSVDVYCAAPIEIGAYSTVSQYSYLCAATHDFERSDHPLVTAPIVIGERCWIAADVFVGPGVSIGNGTVVGARSSVFSDLPEWVIATGTPAKPVRERGLRPEDFEQTATKHEAGR